MKLTGLSWRFDWLRCQRCEGRKFYALRLPSVIDGPSCAEVAQEDDRAVEKKGLCEQDLE